MNPYFTFAITSLLFFCCSSEPKNKAPQTTAFINNQTKTTDRKVGQKVIHVFVALCDNKYQGIVPVPKAIGNGQDASNNLYWGCGYGIKTYFKNSKEWQLVQTISNPQTLILERCIFIHMGSNTILVADAYDGQYIRNCTENFLESCSGLRSDSVIINNNDKIYVAGSANLLCYIGHDGLMDFSISKKYCSADGLKREAIILACISKNYFAEHLRQTSASPLLWSTGLMAPEAYTLHDALEGWINNMPADVVCKDAAKAYSKYQKCSYKAARNLLVTGW